MVELQRRGLTWARNLQIYRDHGFPWMEKILARLPRKDIVEHLLILTFCSCVGMLQNGDYISYAELATLVKDLPMPQSQLQSLQVLSKYILRRWTGMAIFKLDEDIPFKLKVEKNRNVPMKRKQPEPEEEPEDVLEVPPEDVQEVRVDIPPPCPPVGRVRYLPANVSLPWKPVEEDIISLGKESHRTAYATYCEKCLQAGTPARTFPAFKRHRIRLAHKKAGPSA